MIYTVTLNPALDYIINVEKLRFDDINRSVGEKIFYGGKGINVSVILNRLGVDNVALGFLGGFSGEKLKSLLQKDDINCDFNRINGETRINVKIKTDKEIDINAIGPNVTEWEIEELLQKIDTLKDGDYLVLAGSVPKAIPEDIYVRILERLKDKDIRFVVDTTGNSLLEILKYKPFLIKPNHHELGDLFGVKTETEEEIIEYANKLKSMGAQNVLVSRAGDGAILVDRNGEVSKAPRIEGKLISSVGCGDSMVAGFIAGYIKENNYEYALRLGTACGSATAFSEGLATTDKINFVLTHGFNK